MDIKNTPFPVKRALKKFGQDLRDARKRRRIPMELAAERAAISRATLSKIEKGDDGVSLGAYAKVLFILGMIERLVELADPTFDSLGMGLEADNLPKRIRFSRKEKGEE
ncbi:MAG: helix-turn-helix domain-containing protein [Chlamydiales bacterium]